MIGDPSGKATERPLLGPKELEKNVAGLKACLAQFSHLSAPEGVEMSPIEVVDNSTFYQDYKVLDFLRNVGKHFRVSVMLARVRVYFLERESPSLTINHIDIFHVNNEIQRISLLHRCNY